MRKLLSILFVALLVACAQADPTSGPGRTTLLREGWGTVFIAPLQLQGDYEVSTNEDGTTHTVTTAAGSVVINESMDDITLTYPDFKAEVLSEPDHLVVQWGEVKHTFTREGNKMVYQGPIGEVAFIKSDNQLEITGPRGNVLIKQTDGAYTIESPLGKTEYVTTPRGYKLSGLRLTEHPYIKRGAVFQHDGIGVYIELALLDPRNPLFKLLDWDTIVEVETSTQD